MKPGLPLLLLPLLGVVACSEESSRTDAEPQVESQPITVAKPSPASPAEIAVHNNRALKTQLTAQQLELREARQLRQQVEAEMQQLRAQLKESNKQLELKQHTAEQLRKELSSHSSN